MLYVIHTLSDGNSGPLPSILAQQSCCGVRKFLSAIPIGTLFVRSWNENLTR
jgi:hypothetical protein